MSNREKYEVNFECAGCGANGTAHASEAENPVYARGRHFEVEQVSDGFAIARNGDSPQSSKIECGQCSTVFALSD